MTPADRPALSAHLARALVDVGPDAMVLVDADGMIRLANAAAGQLFGYDSGDLVGQPVEMLVPEEWAGAHRAHRTRYRVTPTRRHVGERTGLWGRRADGERIPVDIALSPCDVDGALHVLAGIRDNSAARAARADQIQNQRALNALVDGVYITDPESLRLVYVNDAAAEQCGFSVEELLELTPLDFTPEFSTDEMTEGFARIARRGGSTTIETTLRPRSGIDYPVEVTAQYLEADGDQPSRFIAVVRDISGRVASEAHRRLVEDGVDAVSDAVFFCDEDTFEFINVNQGAVDMYGYSRDELLAGMTPLDLDPERTEEQMRAIAADLADGAHQTAWLQATERRKDGTAFPVEVTVQRPAAAQDGGPRPFVAVVRDISERLAVDEDLRATEARFRAAFDGGPVPMTLIEVTPPTGRTMIDVNQALADLFGYEREELIGRPAADLIHPANVQPDTTQASAVAAGQEVDYEHLVRGVRADGSELWLQRHVSALDPGGDQNKIIVHVVDVTAQVEAEQERARRSRVANALSAIRLGQLRGARREVGLRAACEATIDIIGADAALILTPGDGAESVDVAATAGVSAGLVDRVRLRRSAGTVGRVFTTGEPVLADSVFSPDTPEENRSALADADIGPILFAPSLGAGGVDGILCAFRRREGEPFTEAELEPVRALADGAMEAIRLSEARETRMALEQSEARFGNAFAEAPVAMAIIDVSSPSDRRIIDANQAAATLWGHARETLIGRRAEDLMEAPDTRHDYPRTVALAAGRGERYERLVRGIRADGSRRWLDVHLSALEPGGVEDKLIVHAIDVTERIDAGLRRQRLAAVANANARIRLSMLRGATRQEGLAAICEAATEVVDANAAAIIMRVGTSDRARVEASAHVPDRIIERMEFSVSSGVVGEVFQSQRPTTLDLPFGAATPEANRRELAGHDLGPCVVAPLVGPDGVEGVLSVLRGAQAEPFGESDVESITRFAEGAMETIRQAQARATELELDRLDDRAHLFEEMRSGVVASLFRTGMSLQAAMSQLDDPGAVEGRLSDAVAGIDDAIKKLRDALTEPPPDDEA